MSAGTGGWKVDPSGRHEMRYWDGARWTDSTADHGVQIEDHLDAEDPQSQRQKARPRTVRILAIVGVLAAVGGFFLVRDLWWGLRPTPTFPSLVEHPDRSLQGTVAYIRPYPHNNCIQIVAASGATSKQVACVDGAAGDLEWLPDGRLQSTRYQGGEGTADTKRWIIDVKMGDVEVVPKAQIPPRTEVPTAVVGPNGERVTTMSSRGRLTTTLTTDQATRTLLSVGAPSTYTFGQPAWNKDGSWFVVKDDLDRLLLITTADPSQTRVLVKGGYGQTVTDTDLLDVAS